MAFQISRKATTMTSNERVDVESVLYNTCDLSTYSNATLKQIGKRMQSQTKHLHNNKPVPRIVKFENVKFNTFSSLTQLEDFSKLNLLESVKALLIEREKQQNTSEDSSRTSTNVVALSSLPEFNHSINSPFQIISNFQPLTIETQNIPQSLPKCNSDNNEEAIDNSSAQNEPQSPLQIVPIENDRQSSQGVSAQPLEISNPHLVFTNVIYTLYVHKEAHLPPPPYNLEELRARIPEFMARNYYQFCKDILGEIRHLNLESKRLMTNLEQGKIRQNELMGKLKDMNSDNCEHSFPSDPFTEKPIPSASSDASVERPEDRYVNVLYLKKLFWDEKHSIPKILRDKVTLNNVFYLEYLAKQSKSKAQQSTHLD